MKEAEVEGIPMKVEYAKSGATIQRRAGRGNNRNFLNSRTTRKNEMKKDTSFNNGRRGRGVVLKKRLGARRNINGRSLLK